ncbi:MAG: MaoC family dehydratase [Dehalococcoidia bacterium]
MEAEGSLDLTAVSEGTQLNPLQKEILQGNINLYAEASRDFNPIHIDEEFARNTSLGGTIAHGMLVLAYLSQMLTANFGKDWISGGKLNMRFKTPARPGDTVTISGKIRKIEQTGGQTSIKCDVLCENQSGETIISGDAGLSK